MSDGLHELRGASVLLAGAGNIGSFLAPLLARAGVGVLRLVDRDRVEEKNLAGQDYDPEDVGRSKAEVLADRLRRRFPGLVAEAHAADLEDLPLGTFAVDVVLGALDSRRARQALVSETAWPLGVPVVDGGVGAGLKGRVQVFRPRPEAACLECTWGADDYRLLSAEYPCLPGGGATAPPTLAPAFAGAVVAGVMTAECVRLLTGAAAPGSQEIAFDLLHQRFLVSQLRRAPHCRFDHEVVAERLPLGRDFTSAAGRDLLEALERRFGPAAVHLECRRRQCNRGAFQATRSVPLDFLRSRAGEPLAALGFLPGDQVRARTAAGSVFLDLS
jgi:adenylyltransferase/sulfurtransferase